ncbi:MAG: hypothetical protein IJ963_00220 [Phascolarctobacterium sp.]|nr:hypothetical protein [Phascolarctobacterium sp.]
MIKRILFISLVLLSFAHIVFATRLDEEDKVALIDFGMHSNLPIYSEELNGLAKMAPSYVRANIVLDGRIKLLDDDFVTDKLANANIVVSKYLDKDTLKEIGKTLGCRYLLLGNVRNITAFENGCWYYRGATKCPPNIIAVKTSIDLRLVDVKKNKIISVAFSNGAYRNRYDGISVKLMGYDVSQEAVKKSVEAASKEAVAKLMRSLFRKKK